jgi:hypothetical protein
VQSGKKAAETFELAKVACVMHIPSDKVELTSDLIITSQYEFKRGFATGCFGNRVIVVTHDVVKYSNGH